MKKRNKMKFYLLAVVIAIVAVSCNNTEKNHAENEVVEKSIFSLPFSDIQIQTTSYQLSNETDTVLAYKTGTKIKIPKNAFLDKEGNPVAGDVELNYREFTNPFDIYLGGVPMLYSDSTGTAQVFETAGMFEINASAEGEPVFPNPDNKIQVQMNSFEKGNEYNVYQLDTVSGKWTYLGKDEVSVDNYDEALASLPPVPPAPKKAGLNSFSIEDGTGRYPELSIYENILFEPVDNESCGFHCTEIKVKDIGNGIFEVIFINDIYGVYQEQICKCYLAFKDGVDYDNALKVYQNKYKSLIGKRKKAKEKLEKQWESYFEVKQKYADLGVLDIFYKRGVANLSGADKVTRTLQINGFGFINCDVPTDYPQEAELLAKFKDSQGNELLLHDIALVQKGRNAIFRYDSTVKFNPQQENILWGITKDKKLAYLKADDFKKVNQTQGQYTFVMNVHEGPLTSYEDVCAVLF